MVIALRAGPLEGYEVARSGSRNLGIIERAGVANLDLEPYISKIKKRMWSQFAHHMDTLGIY